MKKTYAFALTAGLFLLGSCAANEPEINPGADVDTSGAGYINFAFTHSTDTRADGDAEEEAIGIETADFLFYAADGRYLGVQSVKADQNDLNAKWISTPSHTVADNQVDLCVALKVPFAEAYSVTVILNKGNVSITSSQNQIATNPVSGNNYKTAKGNWVMSNAVNYGAGNRNTAQSNVATWRVPLDKQFVYENIEAAAAADAKAAATVNVERTVAKMEITASSTCFTKSGDDLIATIGSSNFGATGEATGTIYEIEFTPTNAYATNTPNQGALIKQLPAYTLLDAKEKSFIYAGRTSLCAPHADATLTNWTLSDLATNKKGESLFTDNVRYVYDNSGETGEERSATAVALVGKYNVYKTQDGTRTLIAGADHETVKDFYLMGVGDVWRVFTDEKALLTAMGATQTTTTLKKQMRNGKWTGYMELDGEETPYVCMKYSGGHGYYTRYIELAKEGDKVYSYVTRNHKYQIEINKIEGMGIGIPDGNTPIEPIDPPKPNDKSFYMHISVNVVDWIAVPKQSVNW
ncbi:MAG: fimbria major subunit [Muribaculaceae bacterium]|nr:fimbria major subunit [Muribaculaceae bacterium]